MNHTFLFKGSNIKQQEQDSNQSQQIQILQNKKPEQNLQQFQDGQNLDESSEQQDSFKSKQNWLNLINNQPKQETALQKQKLDVNQTEVKFLLSPSSMKKNKQKKYLGPSKKAKNAVFAKARVENHVR